MADAAEKKDETTDNTFTAEDQKTLDALEKEEKDAAGGGTDETGKSSEEKDAAKKAEGEDKPPEKEPELFLNKYKGRDEFEKAFLANQGETMRLIQSHQSDIAARDKQIADLEAEKASPEPPEKEPEEIPDPDDDMDGYMAAREKKIVAAAEEAAARTFNERAEARDKKDATIKKEAEERDAYANQAMEYIEAYYPKGTLPKDIPDLVNTLAAELDYGKSVGIENIVTARRYREMLDPKRQERTAQEIRAAQIKELRERQTRFTEGGNTVISDEPLDEKNVSGKSYEQLGAEFIKNLK